MVDESNKQEYVDLRLKAILDPLTMPLDTMRVGILKSIPLPILRMLSQSEVDRLVNGPDEIDVAEWKRNAVYNVYNANSGPMCFFWQAIDAMTPTERCQMLMFVTGRVSPNGFSMRLQENGTRFTIAKQFEAMLPNVSVCSFTLNLPEYTSYDECRTNLRLAVDLGGIGFGLVYSTI